jgi:hypothetical protein
MVPVARTQLFDRGRNDAMTKVKESVGDIHSRDVSTYRIIPAPVPKPNQPDDAPIPGDLDLPMGQSPESR